MVTSSQAVTCRPPSPLNFMGDRPPMLQQHKAYVDILRELEPMNSLPFCCASSTLILLAIDFRLC